MSVKLEDIAKASKLHEAHDDQRFHEVRGLFAEVKNEIKFLRENHLTHVERDIAEIKPSIAGINKDIKWMKWFLIPIAIPVVEAIAKTIGRYVA